MSNITEATKNEVAVIENIHHEFAPSSLDRLEQCSGSYMVSKGVKGDDSQIATDGTRLHAGVEWALVTGEINPELSDEDAEVVEKCLTFLESIKEQHKITQVLPEEKVEVKNSKGEVITTGTADVVLLALDYVIVIDWKFGYNDLPNKRQIQSYTLGAMQKFNKQNGIGIVAKLRLNKMQSLEVTLEDVTDIERIIEAAKDEVNQNFTTGLGCTYCPGKSRCPIQTMLFTKFEDKPTTLAERSDEEVINLYEKSKQVDKFVKMVKAQLEKRIVDNGSCGGYIYGEKRGNREVKDVQGLFESVAEFVTPLEFLALTKVPISKVEKLVSDKISVSEGIKKVDAKKRFTALTSDFVSYGKSKKTLEFTPRTVV